MLPNLYNSTTSFRFAQASRPRGQWTLFSLIVADAVSLSLAVGVSLIVRAATGGVVDLLQYARLAVFFPSFVVAYGAVGTLFGGHLEPPGRDPALHPLLRCRLRAFGDDDRFTPRRGVLYNCASPGGDRT